MSVDLKELAKSQRAKINERYNEARAYEPSTDSSIKVSVEEWLELPEVMQNMLADLKGLPMGNITHVFGKSDVGKTTFLMEGIVACKKQGILPILILTEHKFSLERLKVMGVDEDELIIVTAQSIEEAYKYIEDELKDIRNGDTDHKRFFFLDSIGNAMADSELEYDVEDHDKSMGKGAKAIKNLTKRVNSLLGKRQVRNKAGVLLLNQSYQSMPSYGPSVETPYGGEGLIYSCILNIRLRRKGDLKMTRKKVDTIIGKEVLVEMKKNHITSILTKTPVYVLGPGFMHSDPDALKDYKKTGLSWFEEEYAKARAEKGLDANGKSEEKTTTKKTNAKRGKK